MLLKNMNTYECMCINKHALKFILKTNEFSAAVPSPTHTHTLEHLHAENLDDRHMVSEDLYEKNP